MSTNPINDLINLDDLGLGNQAEAEELRALIVRLRQEREEWLASEEEKAKKRRDKQDKKVQRILEEVKNDVL